MEIATIEDYIKINCNKIEQELAKGLPGEWKVPSKLQEAMQYSLMAGGKRMRPILTIAATEAIGGLAELAIPVACAIEMIHTYSLIHDDLPAMDNDDYRRGKLTNHKVFGEAMAVLAGDALLTQAFYEIVQATRRYGVAAEQTLAIVEELSIHAGARGMVGGQAADILGEQGITQLSELEYIHLHKTSDLIVFSLKSGGRVANATENQIKALEQFGYNIGLAFQIQDDILDVIGDEQKLGKNLHSDEKSHKVTYPYFLGIDACRNKVAELTRQGKEAIAQGAIPHPEMLFQLADYLMRRDH